MSGQSEITLESAGWLEPGHRITTAGDGRSFKVLAVEGKTITVRPWRWYDRPGLGLAAWALAGSILVGLIGLLVASQW